MPPSHSEAAGNTLLEVCSNYYCVFVMLRRRRGVVILLSNEKGKEMASKIRLVAEIVAIATYLDCVEAEGRGLGLVGLCSAPVCACSTGWSGSLRISRAARLTSTEFRTGVTTALVATRTQVHLLAQSP